MGSHTTQVPSSCRKLHSIHILVLLHNTANMAPTTLRLVFNFSSFPPRPMHIEVWLIFKLKISTADLYKTTLDDVSSVYQSVGNLLLRS